MATKKFGQLFFFRNKTKARASEGREQGEYPFFTSSPYLTRWTDEPLFSDESLIFGTGGHASIHFENRPFSASSECLVAVPLSTEQINPKYVYYYLIGNIPLLEAGFKGNALKHIRKEYIAQIDIPIRPKKSQDEIVNILDRISGLIQKRISTLHVCDQLPRALFLSRFGDPAANLYRYATCPLHQLATITAGKHLKYLNELRSNSDQPALIRQDAITKRFFDPAQHKILQEGVFPDSRLLIRQDDLLMSRKNTRELVGATAFVFEESKNLYFSEDIFRIHYAKDQVSGVYLYCLFNDENFRHRFGKIAGGTIDSMSNINQRNVSALPIPLPPFEEQVAFENEVRLVYEKKALLAENLEKLKELLTCFSKRVFENNVSFDTDFQLKVLIETVDLERRCNDLEAMKHPALLQELVYRIGQAEASFPEKEVYDKAAKAVLQLLHEKALIQEEDMEKGQIKLRTK